MKRSHKMSNLALAALLCSTFLNAPLKAMVTDDEKNHEQKGPMTPLQTATQAPLPLDLQMTLEGATPQGPEGIHPPEGVPPSLQMTVETKQPPSAIEVLGDISLCLLKFSKSLAYLKADFESLPPQNQQTFYTCFKTVLDTFPDSFPTDESKEELLKTMLHTRKSNEEILAIVATVNTHFPNIKVNTDVIVLLDKLFKYVLRCDKLVRTIKDIDESFPFLRTSPRSIQKDFFLYFLNNRASSETIKAIGTISFKRTRIDYNKSIQGNVTTNAERHILNPDDNAEVDFMICATLDSKTPEGIQATGKALSTTLENLTAWRNLKWKDIYTMANILSALPPKGIEKITVLIGQDRDFFKNYPEPVKLVQAKAQAWRDANPVEATEVITSTSTSSTSTADTGRNSRAPARSSTTPMSPSNPFGSSYAENNPFASPDSGAESSKEHRKKRRETVGDKKAKDDEVQAQVDEVKRIMVENPDRMMNNMERAEDLEGRTDDLTSAQRSFASRSANLRRDMRKKSNCTIQ